MIASVKSDGMRSGPNRASDGIREAAVGSRSGKNTGPDILCIGIDDELERKI